MSPYLMTVENHSHRNGDCSGQQSPQDAYDHSLIEELLPPHSFRLMKRSQAVLDLQVSASSPQALLLPMAT